jgi:hypothetical protein
MAPWAFRSRARIASPSTSYATTASPSRAPGRSIPSARQRIAMTSEAAVMLKPSSRGIPRSARPAR